MGYRPTCWPASRFLVRELDCSPFWGRPTEILTSSLVAYFCGTFGVPWETATASSLAWTCPKMDRGLRRPTTMRLERASDSASKYLQLWVLIHGASIMWRSGTAGVEPFEYRFGLSMTNRSVV